MFGRRKITYTSRKFGIVKDRNEYYPLLDRIKKALEERLDITLRKDWLNECWMIYQEVGGRLIKSRKHTYPIARFYEPLMSSNGTLKFSYELRADLKQDVTRAIDDIAQEKARELQKAQPRTWEEPQAR